jgi:hypothetical protein
LTVLKSVAAARARRPALAAAADLTILTVMFQTNVATPDAVLRCHHAAAMTVDVAAGDLVSGLVEGRRQTRKDTSLFKGGRGRRKRSWTLRWRITGARQRRRQLRLVKLLLSRLLLRLQLPLMMMSIWSNEI